jgi:PAS domain S-box-containing protein
MSNAPTRTILLVNDLQKDRNIIRSYLANTAYKFEFIEADSKAQALEFIEIIQFDCIILDSLLTNLEILRELSKPSIPHKVPVILLSDSRISETAIEALKLAGNEYLLKAEMTADTLQQAVIACVEKADLQATRAEEKIWHKSVLDSLSDSIFTVNLQGEINYLNSAAEQLSGWKASEVIGQTKSKIYQRDDQTASGTVLSPDGQVIPVYDKSLPVQDSLGNILGTIFILKEKKDRNQIAKNEDELITLIAHEIRNPLNSILGYTRLLRMQKNLPDQAIQMLEIIERNGQAQLQFIIDLLDTAKILNGELKLQLRTVNPAQILRDTIAMVRHAIEAKAIFLSLQITDEIPTVVADPERLQQIIYKLISQAIKLTSYEGQVVVRLWQEQALIHLQVLNDGNGIEPHLLSRIFSRFSQSEEKSDVYLSGTGLNLILVKHLVDLLGGSFEVESTNTKHGATLTISLPVQNHDVSISIPKESAVEYKHFTGLRVLVAGKEPELLELIDNVLTKHGAVVKLISSAKDTYEHLTATSDEVSFDLLIADVNLPDEDGYSLIRRIRKLSKFGFSQLPAIALIAVSQAEDRIRCLRAGFQTHIHKPIEPLDMLTVISAILESKENYD